MLYMHTKKLLTNNPPCVHWREDCIGESQVKFNQQSSPIPKSAHFVLAVYWLKECVSKYASKPVC